MGKTIDPNFYAILEELQVIQFVLVELNLYLDTHPNDIEAIEQFNLFEEMRKNTAEKFEKKFGPLFNFGLSTSGVPWQWVEQPWPWQV
nr:spore coat protein CotJB [Bacillus methanolicus]